MSTFDLGALTPNDKIYKNVKCSTGNCELILAGSLPLKWVMDPEQKKAHLYSPGNIEFMKKCLKLKTDPKLVDDAFDFFETCHYKQINTDITMMLAIVDSYDEDTEKKN